MIIDIPFKFSKEFSIKHFLNEYSINMLRILKLISKNNEVSCNEFLINSILKIGFSRSSFFRYLDALNSYELIKRYDLGINESGHQVFYEISAKGNKLLEIYSKYFGIR